MIPHFLICIMVRIMETLLNCSMMRFRWLIRKRIIRIRNG